jgi:endonuclease YncB( thermonuclease family)
LPWTSQLELLRVEDPRKRKALEDRAIREGILRDDLRALVNKTVGSDGRPAKLLPPLVRPTDLKLNTFKLAKPEVADLWPVAKGEVLVDRGFFSYHPAAQSAVEDLLTPTPSYTYRAIVERVIDGDTLVVLIDTGFGDPLEEKLRLRGINTPELGTPEGERAKKFVEKLLPVGATIVLKSHKCRTDTYGRFVGDIFYKAGCAEPEEIIASGTYLNQELLEKGYAVRMEE